MQLPIDYAKTAIDKNDLESLKTYVSSSGANSVLPNGNSLLIYAIQNKKDDCAVFLIENGADVKKFSVEGNSPLMEAFSKSSYRVISKIAMKGGRFENIRLKENTPGFREDIAFDLVIYCKPFEKEEMTECVKELYSNKISRANVTDSHGRTVLHWAVSNGYFELSKYLLSIGFDPNIRDDENKSVYDLAREGLNSDIRGLFSSTNK